MSDYDFDFSQKKSSGVKAYLIEFFQTLAVCLVIGILIYWLVAQPHKVSGVSMMPNFHNNDYIITNKIGYRLYPPKRGDVVVLNNPKDLSEAFIKRIIGLPGEKIRVQNGHVYINGEKLNEPYLAADLLTAPGAFLSEGNEVAIPQGDYIVIGDNRPQSLDSREWGYAPREDIIGQVFFRYWPKETLGLIPTTINYED